jgi:hypothetical protein
MISPTLNASTVFMLVTVKVMTVKPTGTLEVESEWHPAKCVEKFRLSKETGTRLNV